VTEHPLHPFAYEVEYADGRRLRWESPGGPWGEARLPVAGVRRLWVLGPAWGRLDVDARVDDPPTGFVLRLRGTITLPGPAHARRWLFGFREQHAVRGVRLAEDVARGRVAVTSYVGTLEDW